MKKAFLFFTITLGVYSAFTQSDYYYYKGKKVQLTKNERKKYLLLESDADVSNLRLQNADASILSTGELQNSNSSNQTSRLGGKRKWFVIEAGHKLTKESSSQAVAYEAPFYGIQNEEAALSHQFYVQLKNASDLSHLKRLALKNNVEIVNQNQFMPEWYTLACTKNSKGNALAMANLFHESGLFVVAEPSFLSKSSSTCTNDPNFNLQWGLKNTGQNGGTVGVDIKACEAWGITKGSSSVTIAVFDEGVDKTHPDLTNLSTFSYDGHTSTSPSAMYGPHGTSCAGVIGANSNNSLGVSGVAPGCKIMPISVKFDPNGTFTGTFDEGYANGINYAWQNGAAVISNSWTRVFSSSLIDAAIQNALTKGRNNLGTVVVFATGNNNSTVSYPATSNPDILAVGAATPCGQRKTPTTCDGETDWGSNYGLELDVLAPGVLVPTTDNRGADGYSATDYLLTFRGTSAATPHAAALAGLILSVNPNLTQKQVVAMIEQSAQKTGANSYVTTSGRPNGTWNNQKGYGLINAKAALDLAKATIPSTNYLTKFSVPRATAMPSTFFCQSKKVFTFGTGAPDLSKVHNSIFNWQSNQVMQFTLETTVSPYFTELKNFSTFNLNQAQPRLTINNGTAFPGLAGTYYINIHNGTNFVLVEQTGKYALYFSTTTTPPNVRMDELVAFNTEESSAASLIYPNPFVTNTQINLDDVATVTITGTNGKVVEELTNAEGTISLGENYAPGVYIVKIISNNSVRQTTIVKQ